MAIKPTGVKPIAIGKFGKNEKGGDKGGERPEEINNLYGLRTEFKNLNAIANYLTDRNFIKHRELANMWYNELSGVDAHVYLVRDDYKNEHYLVVYWAEHIERFRMKSKIKPTAKQIEFASQLGKDGRLNYGQ